MLYSWCALSLRNAAEKYERMQKELRTKQKRTANTNLKTRGQNPGSAEANDKEFS